MGWFEAIVVFVICWWLIFLPILSAGTTSQHEHGEVARGTERGAPIRIAMRWKLIGATGGAILVTALLWLAMRLGWLAFLAP